MNLIEKRKDNARMIAEGRFIRFVLKEESESIVEAQTKRMREFSFTTPTFFDQRGIKTENNDATIAFKKLHRFVDMKTRNTKNGVIRKTKSYPIYNWIIFGHISNIVRRLSFGFTDDVIEQFKKLED